MSLDRITSRLDRNISRVRNLASRYERQGRGRGGVNDTDVLRAAVVLLHAGMEDYLRSLMVWKLDTFGPEELKSYKLQIGEDWKDKVTLQELHGMRGRSVDELISSSVEAQIKEYQTFSDIGAVKKALERCGAYRARLDAHDFDHLRVMIVRRHHIVHHADRNENAVGRGNYRTRSIGRRHLGNYIFAVEALRDFVTDELGQP